MVVVRGGRGRVWPHQVLGMILILLLAAKFQHVKKIDDVIEAVDPG